MAPSDLEQRQRFRIRPRVHRAIGAPCSGFLAVDGLDVGALGHEYSIISTSRARPPDEAACLQIGGGRRAPPSTRYRTAASMPPGA